MATDRENKDQDRNLPEDLVVLGYDSYLAITDRGVELVESYLVLLPIKAEENGQDKDVATDETPTLDEDSNDTAPEEAAGLTPDEATATYGEEVKFIPAVLTFREIWEVDESSRDNDGTALPDDGKTNIDESSEDDGSVELPNCSDIYIN